MPSPASSASAFGVRVVVPGKTPASAGSISSPPQSASSLVSWSYGDGAVTTGAITGGTNATVDDDRAVGRGLVRVSSVSLFGGEVTADAVTSKSVSRASPASAGGDLSGSGVANLVVLGESVTAAPNAKVTLGDWGYAIALEQAVTDQNTTQRRGHRGFVVGLHVHLTAAHGGLPAGTEIFIGYAEAAATAPKTVAPPPPSSPPSSPPSTHHHHDPVPPPAGALPDDASAGAEPAARRAPAPDGGRLRLPRVRPGVVLRRLRGRARRHRLAPRERHLRAARRPGPRRHRRDALPRRAGTRSAATASGSEICRGTSSTTPTSPRSRRPPGTERR